MARAQNHSSGGGGARNHHASFHSGGVLSSLASERDAAVGRGGTNGAANLARKIVKAAKSEGGKALSRPRTKICPFSALPKRSRKPSAVANSKTPAEYLLVNIFVRVFL